MNNGQVFQAFAQNLHQTGTGSPLEHYDLHESHAHSLITLGYSAKAVNECIGQD